MTSVHQTSHIKTVVQLTKEHNQIVQKEHT